MTEEEWLAATDPDDLVAHLVSEGGLEFGPDDGGPRVPEGALSKRKLSLFYCSCYRCIWTILNTRLQETVVLLEEKAEDPEFSTDEYGFDTYHAIRMNREVGGDTAKQTADQAAIFRDIFPFHPVTIDPSWLTSTVIALAQQMYDTREFTTMPILADALMDAGCDNTQILEHCRGPGPHVRGCWVVDLLIRKG